jgi:hypothetical protein
MDGFLWNCFPGNLGETFRHLIHFNIPSHSGDSIQPNFFGLIETKEVLRMNKLAWEFPALSAVIGRSKRSKMWPAVCLLPCAHHGRAHLFSLWFSARAVRCFHQPAKTFLILAPCGEQRRPWTVRSPPSSRLLSPFTRQSDESERPLVLFSVGLAASPSRSRARLRALYVCNHYMMLHVIYIYPNI